MAQIEKNHDEMIQENEKIQFITFRVNNYEYGIDIGIVKEIKGWVQATPLPNTHEYILGVINLRGAVVPIYDLRCRFGLGNTQPTANHVVMILTVDDKKKGILVDAVSEIITIDVDEVMAVPSIENNNSSDSLFKGLVNFADQMIVLLEIEKIFDQNLVITHDHHEQLADLKVQGVAHTTDTENLEMMTS